MNTNDIAVEYRLSHWVGIMREREENGLSKKQFCMTRTTYITTVIVFNIAKCLFHAN